MKGTHWVAVTVVLCLLLVGAVKWMPQADAAVAAPEPAPKKVTLADPTPAQVSPKVVMTTTALVQEDPAEQERAAFERAEAMLFTNPEGAIALLKQGDEQFPRGALADERQFLKLRAKVNLNQIPEARVDAFNYLEHNPKSPIAPRIHRLLGVHIPVDVFMRR